MPIRFSQMRSTRGTITTARAPSYVDLVASGGCDATAAHLRFKCIGRLKSDLTSVARCALADFCRVPLGDRHPRDHELPKPPEPPVNLGLPAFAEYRTIGSARPSRPVQTRPHGIVQAHAVCSLAKVTYVRGHVAGQGCTLTMAETSIRTGENQLAVGVPFACAHLPTAQDRMIVTAATQTNTAMQNIQTPRWVASVWWTAAANHPRQLKIREYRT